MSPCVWGKGRRARALWWTSSGWPEITNGRQYGALIAFMSMAIHYEGVNFATVGSGYTRKQLGEEIHELRKALAASPQ